MRPRLFFLAAFAVSSLVCAQSLPPRVDLANPSTTPARDICNAPNRYGIHYREAVR
jgi:hypothetical protein